MTQLRLVAVSSSPLFPSGRVASQPQNRYFYVTKLHVFYFLTLFAEFWTHFSKTLLLCYYLGLERLVSMVYHSSSYSSSTVAVSSSPVAVERGQKWTATTNNIINSRGYSHSSRVAVQKIGGQHVFYGCLEGVDAVVKLKNILYVYYLVCFGFLIEGYIAKVEGLSVLSVDWGNPLRERKTV